WKIAEPKQVPGDNNEVSNLLFTITGLRADEFVDPGSPDVQAAQFEKPKAVVWFSAAAPTTQPSSASSPSTRPSGVTVTFGQFTDVDKEKIYVKVSDPNVVARVPMTETSLNQLTG